MPRPAKSVAVATRSSPRIDSRVSDPLRFMAKIHCLQYVTELLIGLNTTG